MPEINESKSEAGSVSLIKGINNTINNVKLRQIDQNQEYLPRTMTKGWICKTV